MIHVLSYVEEPITFIDNYETPLSSRLWSKNNFCENFATENEKRLFAKILRHINLRKIIGETNFFSNENELNRFS